MKEVFCEMRVQALYRNVFLVSPCYYKSDSCSHLQKSVQLNTGLQHNYTSTIPFTNSAIDF